MTRANLGPNDDAAIWAFRYCLGRRTYAVADCVTWLVHSWPLLNDDAKTIIRRDLEEAFERDDRDLKEGANRYSLGMDMDRREWERVRRLWK